MLGTAPIQTQTADSAQPASTEFRPAYPTINMKYIIHDTATKLTRIAVSLLAGGFVLAGFTGCESIKDTGPQFAPVAAKLETIAGGGAKHLVLVNDSGQGLHNVRFSAYMWDDNHLFYTLNHLPQRRSVMTYSFEGSMPLWNPGQGQRFRDRSLNCEISIIRPVSRVQIVGSCDEGSFREDWQMTESGELQSMSLRQRSGQPAGTSTNTVP